MLSPMMRQVFIKLTIALFPIACIVAGTAMIYPPAALIVAGILLWLDLNRKGTQK